MSIASCNMQPKQVTICADDFGQNASINQGIFELAAAKKIQAISCMVNASSWAEGAVALKKLSGIQVGLHFNLTQGQPVSQQWRRQYGNSFPSLPKLLTQSFAKRLEITCIKDELMAQWEHFIARTGRVPDFVDGHQHVHQFGVVRQAIYEFFLQQNFQGACRISTNGLKDIFTLGGFPKPMLMWLLGGQRLKKKLSTHPVRFNSSFAGFYPFKQSEAYRTYFRKFLAQSQSGGLIMCHPGKASQDKEDPLHRYRVNEYLYLMSEAYALDLKEFGIELAN